MLLSARGGATTAAFGGRQGLAADANIDPHGSDRDADGEDWRSRETSHGQERPAQALRRNHSIGNDNFPC